MIKPVYLSFFLMLLNIQGCVAAPTDSYYFRKDGQKITLFPLHIRTQSNLFTYRNTEGKIVKTDGTILAGCNRSPSQCQAVFHTFDIKSVQKLAPGIYAITPNNPSLCFDLSRKLYHHPDITFAHPNFTKAREKR